MHLRARTVEPASAVQDSTHERTALAEVLAAISKDTKQEVHSDAPTEIDVDELSARKEAACVLVDAEAVAPFDPDRFTADRKDLESISRCEEAVEFLLQIRRVLGARLLDLRERNSGVGTRDSAQFGWIVATGTAALTLAFSPTIAAVFFNDADPLLGMLFAVAIGGCIGLFIVLNLVVAVGGDAAVGRSRIYKWAAIGLGLGFGTLRCAKADGIEDVVAAVGFTLIECGTVSFLYSFGEQRRVVVSRSREAQARLAALEHEISGLDREIAATEALRARIVAEIRKRERAALVFELLSGRGGAVIEAPYRAAINANRKQAAGGSPFSTPRAGAA